MADPVIAASKPSLVTLVKGKTYLWCSCGLSARQPFCDGSHRSTEFEPKVFTCDADGDYLLCACKHTRNAPFCDGSHNNLSDSYEEASEDEILASAHLPITPRDSGATGKAVLDGGCYVRTLEPARLERRGNITYTSLIHPEDGARCLSLFHLNAHAGEPAVMAFPGSKVALFVLSGHGTLTISGKAFAIAAEQSAYISEEEAFAIEPDDSSSPLRVTLTICPERGSPEWHDRMPDNFDHAWFDRVFAVDPAKREAMADRFYQVLIDDRNGSADMTQFIGEVPCSRAALHRHLYEETITVLSGHGFMWTENARAEVQPGDVIFLPRRQQHSLECTSDSGMRLVGVFFPAGSPAVNY
ncbi:MAG: CDGSH iron-sulfur domain-containing protein [Xanthomonadales bacterium]|nr:CDGSH iron-sulfur domain-containing protein [Xanthomonadales bacterium]